MKDEDLKLTQWYRKNPILYVELKDSILAQGMKFLSEIYELTAINQHINPRDYLPKDVIFTKTPLLISRSGAHHVISKKEIDRIYNNIFSEKKYIYQELIKYESIL